VERDGGVDPDDLASTLLLGAKGADPNEVDSRPEIPVQWLALAKVETRSDSVSGATTAESLITSTLSSQLSDTKHTNNLMEKSDVINDTEWVDTLKLYSWGWLPKIQNVKTLPVTLPVSLVSCVPGAGIRLLPLVPHILGNSPAPCALVVNSIYVTIASILKRHQTHSPQHNTKPPTKHLNTVS